MLEIISFFQVWTEFERYPMLSFVSDLGGLLGLLLGLSLYSILEMGLELGHSLHRRVSATGRSKKSGGESAVSKGGGAGFKKREKTVH